MPHGTTSKASNPDATARPGPPPRARLAVTTSGYKQGMEILSSRLILRPRDRARSLAFYRDTLGLAIFREFAVGTVFFLGQGFLEVSGEAEQGSPSPDQVLWLQVRDVRAEHARLVERGVTSLEEPERKPWGLEEAWIADPDGVRIVLVHIPEDHPLRTDVRQG